MCLVSYQQSVTASHDAKAQARAALGDVDGGLTAGDDGTGRRVAGQSGRSGRATGTLNRGRKRIIKRVIIDPDE